MSNGKIGFGPYITFRADTVLDFDDAVLRHEVIDAIERSASTGKRVKV